MKIERRSWERRSWEGKQEEPDISAGAFLAFVVALLALAGCIWGAVSILEAQSAISWTLKWWQAIALAFMLIVVNAMFQTAKVKR